MKILGIDVGGSGIKGAIVDTDSGELVTEKFRLKTPRPAKPEAVAKVVHQLVDHFNWKGKVGVGFPTPLAHGKSMSGGNLHKKWKGVQVDKLFSEKNKVIGAKQKHVHQHCSDDKCTKPKGDAICHAVLPRVACARSYTTRLRCALYDSRVSPQQ